MSHIPILFFFVFLLSCESNSTNDSKLHEKESTEKYNPERIDTVYLGDIDGNGAPDSAFVFTPQTNLALDEHGDTLFSMSCKDNHCFNRISFSGSFPTLTLEESVWGQVESIDDIDEDGIKELLVATSWFTTTRSNLYLYSYKKDRWVELGHVSFRNGEHEPLKKQYFKKGQKRYLIGIKNVDGDEVEWMKEIGVK